jgi:hypothetical protein
VQITSGTLLTGSVSFPTSAGNQLTFTPPDAGTDTISLSATDVYGSTGVTTASLTVTEIPVTVNAGANAVGQQSTPFTQTGSFTDAPGDGPWTATVNYGDGTGNQSLAVNANMSFTLSHTFASAGTFTTTVSVTNQHGLTGTASFYDSSASGTPMVSAPCA